MDHGAPVFIALVAGSGLILAYWAFRRTSQRKSLPPGPPTWPIIGNLLDIPKDFGWFKYNEWSEQYATLDSDIIHLDVLGMSIVVLNSLEAINNLFEGKAQIYSDRPKSIMLNELMGWDKSLVLLPYGDVWRSQRRAFHREFQPHAISRYHPKQIKVTQGLLRLLLGSPQFWAEHIRQQAGAAIMDITYGIEVLPENDPYIELAVAAMDGINTAGIPGAFLVDVFPLLKFVPAWVPGAGFQRKAKEWRRLFGELIVIPFTESQKKMANGTAKTSFVSRSLSAINPDHGNPEMEEKIIRDTASMVYAGGADTIPVTTNTFMAAMLINPAAQARAQAELDDIIGKGQLPTFADKDYLPYITAIVKETLRWQPVAPVAMPRQLKEDDEYKGYHIPKGSIVIPNSWAILHDEKVYPDPFSFNPERFIKDGQLDLSVQDPEEAGAFGYGRRVCPGKALAFDAVWLNVASILAAFHISSVANPDGTVTEPKFSALGIQCSPDRFDCVITPRSKEMAELIQATAHAD